ncbi:hypothetical protein E6O75_ATG03373 [Venturia nashicola]|uniref:Uncharacterized protein n=1 Tax=Venturia nashicola TaxID=86259 RepID=A0A4Z1P4L0_9PEZI|nr:hypothetical protein E6O75_ATG03373 [Venturia nashicola]
MKEVRGESLTSAGKRSAVLTFGPCLAVHDPAFTWDMGVDYGFGGSDVATVLIGTTAICVLIGGDRDDAEEC